VFYVVGDNTRQLRAFLCGLPTRAEEHWNLVTDPCDYYYSTASFYEKNILNFAFIKDLRKEF